MALSTFSGTRHLLRVISGASLLGATCALAAPSATVSYHGVTLHVQDRRDVGPDTLQLSVKDETFVVAESEAGRRVATRLLQDNAEGLSPAVVSSLAARAAQVSDGEVLGAALGVIFQHDEWVEFDTARAWQDIAASAVGRARMVISLSDAVERPVGEKVCASLRALYDYQSTLQVEALARKVSSQCLHRNGQRAIREAFLGNDGQELAREMGRLVEVFEGEESPDRRSLGEASGVLLELHDAIAGVDVTRFEQALARLEAIGELLGVAVAERDPSIIREQFIGQAVERGAFVSVCKLLPGIRAEKRTPALHMAVLRAIDGVTAQEIAEVVTPDVQEALRHFAEKDEEIALHSQRMVQRGVEYALARGQPETAYRLLLGSRGAASDLPAELRSVAQQVAEAFLKQRDVARAEQVAASMLGNPSLILRLKLGLARIGVSLTHAALFLVLFVAGVVLARIRRVRRHRREGICDSNASPPKESVLPSTEKDASWKCSEELSQALASFGLSPGATLAEIKNAYRMRVKGCHPDRNPDASVQDNSEFVRLTSEYDRLLTLYQRERASDK